jgi:4-hydroxy-2-oxoheptanedioate aldolase
MTSLKQKIQSGQVVHGSWVNLGSTVSAEIIGNAGFDWVLIDLEHGAGNDAVMYQQLQVLESTDATPLVRIDELSRPRSQRILDAGAGGIMFPRIDNAVEAKLAASMLYYPPNGIRGMAKMIRASGFGKHVNEYASMEKNIIGIIQIETINAVEQIDGIAAINGVDVLFVGPSDLTMALGIFNQFDHPVYQNAIADVAKVANKHKKAAGVLLQNINEYKMYYDLGYRVLACGGDAAFVAKGAADLVKEMKLRSNRQ